MKIAIISDIHANLPALEAVLKDLETYRPDYVFCLGDLVNFAGWDNEVVHIIRNKRIVCVRGNHDEGIGENKDLFDFSYANEEERDFTLKSIKYVNLHISNGNRKFLRELPVNIRFELQFQREKLRLVLSHFIPDTDRKILFRSPDDRLVEYMDAMEADVLLLGHLHVSLYKELRDLKNGRKFCRPVVVVGAVGKSKPNYSSASYCMLEIEERPEGESSFIINHKFVSVPYDGGKVLEKIRSIGLSSAFDRYFTTDDFFPYYPYLNREFIFRYDPRRSSQYLRCLSGIGRSFCLNDRFCNRFR